MMNKLNYDKLMKEELSKIKGKPTLLLHVCCGPCTTIPLNILKKYFKITLIFNNSNIYPKEEFYRRKDELKRYLIESKNEDINVIEMPYENEEFMKDLLPYSEMKEGHERCRICFTKRLKKCFEYASKNGFDYFTTVMTISRYKNAQDINEIGKKLEEEFSHTKWLYADFKKNNGYEDSLLICKDFNLYFQDYCGCIFSYKKRNHLD